MRKASGLHPKAYLTSKRNVKAGLVSRTKILFVLERGQRNVRDVARDAGLSYECVAYHLKNMKRERLVDSATKKKPFVWGLTPFGQQRLPYK